MALPSVALWGCVTRGPLLPAAAYRNLGQNLWGPHRYGCLSGVRVRTVVSGSCAAHSLLITTEGKLWSWGKYPGSQKLTEGGRRGARVLRPLGEDLQLPPLLRVLFPTPSQPAPRARRWSLPSCPRFLGILFFKQPSPERSA